AGPHAAARRGPVSAGLDRDARGRARPARRQSTRVATVDERRLPVDDELEVEGGRSGGREPAAARHVARHAEPPRAPPRPADGIPAAARRRGAGDLRAVRGRSDVRVVYDFFSRCVSVSIRPRTTAPSATETCGATMSPSTEPVSRISTRLAAVIVPVTEPRMVTLRASMSAWI